MNLYRLLAPTALAAATLAATPGAALASTMHTPMPEVKVATVAKYGKILVTESGLALYYDTANKAGKWACTGDCLTAWPPLLLPKGEKKAVGGTGVMGLGTVMGVRGLQVTWEGKALYTFFQDSKGTVKGQGIKNVWFVAQVNAASTTSSGGGWG